MAPLTALAAGHSRRWVHNAAHTQDIEALRRIALDHAKWWNDTALPAIAAAVGCEPHELTRDDLVGLAKAEGR